MPAAKRFMQMCPHCGRSNLPQGLRCAYCGALFPAVPPPVQRQGSTPVSTAAKAKRGGVIGSLLLLLAKLKAVLIFLKAGPLLLTLSTMLISYEAYAHFFGWKFGLGIVLSIFIHEMGHVAVNKAKGLKTSAPVFLPLMGAVIFLKNFPDNPTIQSESGAGGPAAGGLAACVCFVIALATHSAFWMGIANFGFLINLFNLVPFPPLDGSHISTVFSPGIWNTLLALLLLAAIKMSTPILWAVVLIGFAMRLGAHNQNRYLLALPSVRIRMAVLYLVMCLGLSAGFQATRSNNVPFSRATARHAAVHTVQSAPQTLTLAQQKSRRIFRIALAVAMLAFYSLLWLAASLLLCRAARVKMLSIKPFLFPTAFFLIGLFYAGLHFEAAVISRGTLFLQLYALFAMSAAALIYGGWSAVYRDRLQAPASYQEYTGRTLLWSAAAGLAAAFAAGSFTLVLLPAALAALCLFTLPWLISEMKSEYYARQQEYPALLRETGRALSYNLPPENRQVMLIRLAEAALAEQQGRKALEYLEQTVSLPGTPARDALCLQIGAKAHILQEEYSQALEKMETMLQAQNQPALVGVCLLLADMARHRGWYDDAEVRLRWLLSLKAKALIAAEAGLHIDLAATLLDAGKTAEAEAELNAMEKLPMEAPQRRRWKILQAACTARCGNSAAAKEQMQALQAGTTALEYRYRLARLQNDVGDAGAEP